MWGTFEGHWRVIFVDETHVLLWQIYTPYTRDRLKFSFLKATFSLDTISVLQFSSFYSTFLLIHKRLKATLGTDWTPPMFPVRFLKRMVLDTTQAFYRDPEALLFQVGISLWLFCPCLAGLSLWLHQEQQLTLRCLHRRSCIGSLWTEILRFKLRRLSSVSQRHLLGLPLHPLLHLCLHPSLFCLYFLCGGDGVLLGSSLGLSWGFVTSFEHLEWHTDNISGLLW